jgi:hypothetical protein
MNKLPIVSFHLQAYGLSQKVELDLPILLPKLQEILGVDLKLVVIPLLTRFIRSQIARYSQDNLTKEEGKDLKNLQEQEKNLVSC